MACRRHHSLVILVDVLVVAGVIVCDKAMWSRLRHWLWSPSSFPDNRLVFEVVAIVPVMAVEGEVVVAVVVVIIAVRGGQDMVVGTKAHQYGYLRVYPTTETTRA